ncbi:MAG: AMP-binding protein [Verrucomicrobiales bacterium]|nr:AMP-binding protein [Verrucomicrobiales bacterium]
MPTDLPPPPTASTRHLRVIGAENLPTCGCLIIPNHLPLADLLRLQTQLPGKKIVLLVEAEGAHEPALRAYLERPDVEAVSFDGNQADPSALRDTLRELTDAGTIVLFVPALCATMKNPVTTVPGGRLELLTKVGVPVLPVALVRESDLALTFHSRHDDEVILAIGHLLTDDELSLSQYQEEMFALSEQAFSASHRLEESLPMAVLRGLKKHSRCRVIDGKDDSTLTFDKVLAAAAALSRVIRAETSKQRVGIVLPPSAGGLIANVAVLLAGKIPVNLNFTASHASITSAMKRADLDRIITVDLVVRKMQSFPWPPSKNLFLMERRMPALKLSIAKWLVLSKLLPTSLLASMLGVERKGGDHEAVLLFTSGSSGEPKGVALTHRNILANIIQFGSRLQLEKEADSILGCLPLFHSFGSTVTLWYPLMEGINLITYPTPLETKKLAALIEHHRISLMIATPTLLRGYQRGVNREQLQSLKLIVTGAEKLPQSVAEAFEARFGKRVLEGYGLTETSPVTNFNLPDPDPIGESADGFGWMPANRFGSVGQMMPGMGVRITEPDGHHPLPLHQSGMIWLKGPNVFRGYLGDPVRTKEVIDENGWFRTGDVGRVDMDGFLYIEGRLSRFSKIAGEMVPHEAVEDALTKALALENESSRRIAIVGIPDAEKGEAIVLLSTLPGGPEQQEILDLRYRLLDRGIPPLWIPKKMVRVQEIPVLASGKLDVQGCLNAALAAV